MTDSQRPLATQAGESLSGIPALAVSLKPPGSALYSGAIERMY